MPRRAKLDELLRDARLNQTAGENALNLVADFKKRTQNVSAVEAREILTEVLTVAGWIFLICAPLATLIWNKGVGGIFTVLSSLLDKIVNRYLKVKNG